MTAISQPQLLPRQYKLHLKPSLPWLNDPTKAAQHLTRITLESSAQAALITRKNNLWAYAGSLSQNAAKEVAQTVTRNWDGQKGSDLLRFIRLESTKAEHMLYATRLDNRHRACPCFRRGNPVQHNPQPGQPTDHRSGQ